MSEHPTRPEAELELRRSLITRRVLLENLLRATALGATAAALPACGPTFDDFRLAELFPRHYQDMSTAQLEEVVAQLEDQIFKQYRKRPVIHTDPPKDGVRWVMTLDLSACLGCGQCAQGCFEENNQGRDPEIKWITMLRSPDVKVWRLHHTETFTRPVTDIDDNKFYLPVGCQQCDHPACVRACPINATWKEPDGVTVVDYNWCIGCRYCMAACPYDARKFNWAPPKIPVNDLNTFMHYLGNRPRPYGVVEKCTFCVQRVRAGYEPACVAVCPVGARRFGDLNDESSGVSLIVDQVKTIQLKEDVGTEPRFYYYFSMGLT